MSSNVLKEKESFDFIWRIENFSYSNHTGLESLASPPFLRNTIGITKWNLILFHKNTRKTSLILCAVHRSEEDSGPEIIPCRFQISFLASDGSAIKSSILQEDGMPFKKNSFSVLLSASKKEVVFDKKELYLPQDVLTIQCKMWEDRECCCKAERISARSRLSVERASILRTVKQFSSGKSRESKSFAIKSKAKGTFIMCIKTNVILGSDEDKVMAQINVTRIRKVKFLCKIYLLNAVGKKILCGIADTRYEPAEVGVQNLHVPLDFSKKELIDRKEEYLPEDVLYLQFEFHFINGCIQNEIQQVEYNIHSKPETSETTDDIGILDSLSNDLHGLYKKREHCDIELKTPTKSFFVHKLMLRARSSVFKAMLAEVGSAECIEIKDLDDEILEQFLYFLYTGHLKNMQWKTACEMYYAAKEYDVPVLERKCFSLLMHKVDPSNVCEILILADKHQDSLLKNFVVDFILEHDVEIFMSDEWEALMQSNLQLTSQIMLSKYKKGTEKSMKATSSNDFQDGIVSL